MEPNKKLEDIVLAIERWKDDCEERGKEPVCIANFVSTGSSGVDDNARGVLIGEPEDISRLLAYMVEIISSDAILEDSKNTDGKASHEQRLARWDSRINVFDSTLITAAQQDDGSLDIYATDFMKFVAYSIEDKQ